MANTTAHRLVQDWITDEWLPKRYSQTFSEVELALSPGGVFNFDAVSEDRQIVANISTSQWKTAPGRHGSGKVHKIRSDIYFLLLTQARLKLVVLTEEDMHGWWLREAAKRRVPTEIEFLHAAIPNDLDTVLRASRRTASREVTPGPFCKT